MARWENEDVSDLDIPDPVSIEETFIDLNGDGAAEEKNAVAKSTKSSHGSLKFYIKYGRSELLDPHGTDSSYTSARKQIHMYKFKRVSGEIFKNYTKYLKSKNRMYFTKARRFLMEN